jgi:hypothetical protein
MQWQNAANSKPYYHLVVCGPGSLGITQSTRGAVGDMLTNVFWT